MPATDEYLIKRIKAGSHKAFGLLIDRYQDYVFSLCLKVVGKREEAEEAAQDVFLKLHKRIDSFREESRFTTWLYTLTYRTAIDYSRKRDCKTTSIDGEQGPRHLATGKSDKPDFQLQQKDLKKALEALINRLPEQERVIIDLYYLQEQSVREIAAIMKLSVTNVKTKLFRTREQLRKLTKQQIGRELVTLYRE